MNSCGVSTVMACAVAIIIGGCGSANGVTLGIAVSTSPGEVTIEWTMANNEPYAISVEGHASQWDDPFCAELFISPEGDLVLAVGHVNQADKEVYVERPPALELNPGTCVSKSIRCKVPLVGLGNDASARNKKVSNPYLRPSQLEQSGLVDVRPGRRVKILRNVYIVVRYYVNPASVPTREWELDLYRESTGISGIVQALRSSPRLD